VTRSITDTTFFTKQSHGDCRVASRRVRLDAPAVSAQRAPSVVLEGSLEFRPALPFRSRKSLELVSFLTSRRSYTVELFPREQARILRMVPLAQRAHAWQ
jgi:hypothetical protein